MSFVSIFSNVIHTSIQSKNPSMRPLILKANMKNAMKKIRTIFQENGLVNIYEREDYGEIYGEQYPYEISCHLIADKSNVICHLMVYNTEGRKKKKAFLFFKEVLKTNLDDILDIGK